MMMATIFNSSIFNSAILDSAILLKTLTQTSSFWLKLIYSDSTCQDISLLEFCNLGFGHFAQKELHSFILIELDDSSHLEFCHQWIWPFCTIKNFTHLFWLNLMMAAILNSAMLESDTFILDSDTLLSSLRFTQKHSPSTLTLSQTNSIWLT